MITRLVFALTLFSTAILSAAAPAPGTILLEDGDTLVFLGDSITHRGPYSQYVETYFVTRFPERRIRFVPSGISGDRAADALARFDEDVAVHKPKYVSVLLGMNDGGYKDFDRAIFETYRKDMETILDRIVAIGATPLVLSPTIFDQRQYAEQCKDPSFRFIRLQASDHYNATMAFFGSWMRERAMDRKLPFADFWGPLNSHTVTQRHSEPAFTLATDAIHPGPAGHAIMAFSFLDQLSPERRTVSNIRAQFLAGKWRVTAANGNVSDVEGTSDSLSFTMKANSLPWVLPEEAAAGYALTKAGHKRSNEQVSIAGLSPGLYEIEIDGQNLGKRFSHVLLGRKIELQENAATPQYQQAAKVAALVKERHEQAHVPYRDIQAGMKGQRRKHGLDSPEIAAYRQTIQPQLNELKAKAEKYDDAIYTTARPRALRYVIRKVAGIGRPKAAARAAD